MEVSQRINRSDILGVLASGLCAIHCGLTPLFFATQPLLEAAMGEHTHSTGWWALLDYIFLVLSLIAVWYSAKHTNHVGIKWRLWIAWGIFMIGLLSEPFHFAYGKWLMYAGSAGLIITHFQNYRYCQKCKKENNQILQ